VSSRQTNQKVEKRGWEAEGRALSYFSSPEKNTKDSRLAETKKSLAAVKRGEGNGEIKMGVNPGDAKTLMRPRGGNWGHMDSFFQRKKGGEEEEWKTVRKGGWEQGSQLVGMRCNRSQGACTLLRQKGKRKNV